jgi:hypothetical protein
MGPRLASWLVWKPLKTPGPCTQAGRLPECIAKNPAEGGVSMDEQDVPRYEPISLCGLQSLAVYFLRGPSTLCAVRCSVRLDTFDHDRSMNWVQAVECRNMAVWVQAMVSSRMDCQPPPDGIRRLPVESVPECMAERLGDS